MTEIATGDEYVLDMIEEIDDVDLLARIYDKALLRRAALLDEPRQRDERAPETYKRGDIVWFQRGISPKYLVGKTAVVVKVNPKSVVVNVPDEPEYRRFRGAKNVRCPKNIVSGRPN